MDIYTWVTIAKKKIRLPIRRAKFKKEIFRRYRCRLESLTAEGMDPVAAKKTVMEELGDPVETGEMAQVLYRQHWMPLPEPGMPYMQKNVYIWTNTAARQLLSRRKRNELRRAAGAYYHARVAELTAGGMEQREAEKLAMAGFGDPKQIGRAARRRDGLLLMPLTLRYWKPEEKSGLDQFARGLSKAVKPVNFPPDRSAVEQELVEHFEERVEGFTTHGMGSVEAMRSAVERLGDPRQTGALLRKVHKPWLGWLLRTARVLLVLLVLLGLYRSSELKKRVEEKWEAREELQYYVDGNINHLVMNGELELDYYYSAPCAIRRGTSDGEGVLLGHRVRFYAANAFWWRTTADPEAFYSRNYLVLQVETPPWTTPDPGKIRRHLKLMDENGEVISYYDLWLIHQNLTSAWYTIKIYELFDQINLQYQDERSSFEMQVDYGPREDFFERAPASNEPEAMDAAFEENMKGNGVKYYTAEPVQIDGLELSVRQAAYISSPFDPEEKRGSDIISCFDIQLELRGPSERIPVDGLKGKLRLTDAEGNMISLRWEEQSFCEDRVYYLGEASGDHVPKISGGPSEWYELRFRSESGREVALQLVPVEGE